MKQTARKIPRAGILGAAALAFAPCLACAQDKPSTKPNVVLVLVDDSGFSDLSCYGSEIPTPNLDRLAAGGMRFTQFFNASRCMPTRTALLAGNYNHYVGCPMMEGPGASYDKATGKRTSSTSNGAILRETPNLGEVFRHNGYETFHTGKWHAGEMHKPQWPLQRGFDKFYGTLKGATPNKFDGSNMYEGNEPIAKPVPEGWFIGNAITGKALEYLRGRDKTKPFFLYHCPLEPHWPFQAPEADIAPFAGKYDAGYDVLRKQRLENAIKQGVIPPGTEMEPRDPHYPPWEQFKASIPDWQLKGILKTAETYAGSIKNIDDNVGRIVAELEKQGVMDNTIFMFLSDNGSENCAVHADGTLLWPFNTVHNAPFRMHKTFQHNGGIATPFIVHWPAGGVPAGTINKAQTGHVKDVMATLLEAAGCEFPTENLGLETWPHGSESLLAAWRDPNHSEPRTYFFEHDGRQAVRQGKWKLVTFYNRFDPVPGNGKKETIPRHIDPTGWRPFNARPRDQKWELYDMDADPTEMRDLAAGHPEKVAELSALFDAFWKKTHWKIREDLFADRIKEWEAQERAGEAPAP